VVKLPIQWFALSGGVGKQTIEMNDVFGTPDYMDWMGVPRPPGLDHREPAVGRDEQKESACFGGTTYCKTRVVFSVARAL